MLLQGLMAVAFSFRPIVAQAVERVNNGLSYSYVLSLGVSGSNIFAGTYGGGIFLSTNSGTSWAAS